MRILAEEAEEALATIVAFGQIFLTQPSGEFVVRKLGGHSKARVHYSPNGGTSLAQALRGAAAHMDVDLFEDLMVCALVGGDQNRRPVDGIVAYDMVEGDILCFDASAVVLATGGAGWLFYPHTDNIKTVTGDGYALALRAGAGLVDMEQVQFLPFSVAQPESMRGVFAGEPSRVGGPEGVLRDANGNLVIDQLNRRQRDEVSNAVFAAMRQGPVTRGGGVLLDLSGNRKLPPDDPSLKDWVRPSRAVRQAYGRDAFLGKIPFEVQPTVHHMMGGIWTDVDGCSNVQGLFAAGEARGGVHGGNRLGATAHVDSLVFGRRAGRAAAAYSGAGKTGTRTADQAAAGLEDLLTVAKSRRKGERAAQLRRETTDAVWHAMGGPRSRERCQHSLACLRQVRARQNDCALASQDRWNLDVLDFLELQLMIPSAEAILLAASLREESRGAHVWEGTAQREAAFAGKRTRVSLTDGALAAEWMAVA